MKLTGAIYMKKMKGSGNYLKNQVRKNLAKAIACLLLFFLISSVLSIHVLLTLSFGIFEIAGFLISLVPLAAFYYFLRKYRIYGGGWEGEKRVIKLLGSKLSDDYVLLNDMYLRGGGGDIDHVILGPNGIFVLETKNWNGNISCNGDYWQRSGKQNFKASPSLQVKRNVATIRHILDSSQALRRLDIYIEGIVVFTNNYATLHLTNPTVAIVKLPQLPNQITTIRSLGKYSQEQLETIGKEILKQKR
jgi:hypothetical protein